MIRNYKTLVVQSDSATSQSVNPVRMYTCSPFAGVFTAIAFVLIVLFGISGSWTVKQNRFLEKQIVSLENELREADRIDKSCLAIREQEVAIRQFLGLYDRGESIDINERMGKGGDEPEIMIQGSTLNPVTRTSNTVNASLDSSVYELQEDIRELKNALSKMTATLSCRPTIMPVKDEHVWISSSFGWRKSPFTGLRQFHHGIDISGRKGTPIIATADGTVSKVGYNRFIGHYVRIKHDDRYMTTYGHMLKYVVKKHERVKRGQVLGYMGTSGMSTGYHLHYEVLDSNKKVNPYHYILNRKESTFASS